MLHPIATAGSAGVRAFMDAAPLDEALRDTPDGNLTGGTVDTSPHSPPGTQLALLAAQGQPGHLHAGFAQDHLGVTSGAASSRAAGDEGYVRELIARELHRVQSLQTGAGTLVDRQTLRTFDAVVREAANPRANFGSTMKMFGAGGDALEARVASGGYGFHDGVVPSRDQAKVLQLQALGAGEIDAVNSVIARYCAAYSGMRDDLGRPRMQTTAAVSGFADAYGQLSENQRGHVLAGIVNNAVRSQEYMDNYRAGGYMRDHDKPLEGTAAPWEIIDPRSLFRLAASLGRDAAAGGAAMLGAGREILGSLVAKGESYLARFTADGALRSGAASVLEGGPALINKIWASSMTLKTNAQLYGSTITRTVNDIPGLMQKAGYSAEDLAGSCTARPSQERSMTSLG